MGVTHTLAARHARQKAAASAKQAEQERAARARQEWEDSQYEFRYDYEASNIPYWIKASRTPIPFSFDAMYYKAIPIDFTVGFVKSLFLYQLEDITQPGFKEFVSSCVEKLVVYFVIKLDTQKKLVSEPCYVFANSTDTRTAEWFVLPCSYSIEFIESIKRLRSLVKTSMEYRTTDSICIEYSNMLKQSICPAVRVQQPGVLGSFFKTEASKKAQQAYLDNQTEWTQAEKNIDASHTYLSREIFDQFTPWNDIMQAYGRLKKDQEYLNTLPPATTNEKYVYPYIDENISKITFRSFVDDECRVYMFKDHVYNDAEYGNFINFGYDTYGSEKIIQDGLPYYVLKSVHREFSYSLSTFNYIIGTVDNVTQQLAMQTGGKNTRAKTTPKPRAKSRAKKTPKSKAKSNAKSTPKKRKGNK